MVELRDPVAKKLPLNWAISFSFGSGDLLLVGQPVRQRNWLSPQMLAGHRRYYFS
jgi:hypothetical protein